MHLFHNHRCKVRKLLVMCLTFRIIVVVGFSQRTSALTDPTSKFFSAFFFSYLVKVKSANPLRNTLYLRWIWHFLYVSIIVPMEAFILARMMSKHIPCINSIFNWSSINKNIAWSRPCLFEINLAIRVRFQG